MKIIDTYVLWTAAIITLPMLIYGVWFQTEGLTLEAITLREILASMAIGGMIALVIMVFLMRQTQKERPQGGKKPVRTDLLGMLRGNMICLVFFIIMTYTATSVTIFQFGIGGMTYALVSFWFFLIWGMIEKLRKEKEKKAGEETA